MRRIVTAFACAVTVSTALAQQDPQFTQYMFDRLSINPGSAGTNGNMCLTALLRQQWTGFDGAPKTGLLNFQMPINAIHSGVGLSVYLDQARPTEEHVGSLVVRLSCSFARRYQHLGYWPVCRHDQS
ncbi:MAG: type IX secretion system membrane protein PorP/SprF [Flavobacteriales bacterium]|nr:type IX secretion system membrane protein PorP/SprF [Flavobacteriales bacterium]